LRTPLSGASVQKTMLELLKPQIKHSRKLLDSLFINGIATDLSQTGTGKTYVAAWMAKQIGCGVDVICPKTVKKTWVETLTMAGVTNFHIHNYEKLVRGNTEYLEYDLGKFHATNKWWLSDGIYPKFRKDNLIILDEVHKCRGQKSLASDLLIALKNHNYKLLKLSATAATSVADMKAFGYSSNLHDGENYKSWCFDHGARYNSYGTIVWDGDQTVAKEGIKRIHHNLFEQQKIAGRMTRDQFGDIFPENRLFADVFDLGSNNSKLERVYDIMQQELDLLDERAKNYKQHVFAIMMKARRESELLKVPVMVEWIEDMYNEGISPVVFVNFNDTVDALKNRLNKSKFHGKIGYLLGEQDENEKNQDIQDFQNDIKRIFIANIAAGNLGISLHDLNGNFPRFSLINPSWSAVNFVQATGRIVRAKGKSACIQRFLYANVDVEKRMADRMKARIDNLECLNDGDLSYEFAFQ
jgi:hypothetical protein